MSARPMPSPVQRRLLLQGRLLQIGTVRVEPSDAALGELESTPHWVLALTLRGLFRHHEGPRQSSLATPGHALMLAPDRPYRLSFPGAVGDDCLLIRLAPEAFAQALPAFVQGSQLATAACMPLLPLPAALMLARSQLLHAAQHSAADALALEERALTLVQACLQLAARDRQAQRRLRLPTARMQRAVGRVQEAIWSDPAQPWTLPALAALAHCSAGHLAHAFRALAGQSVHAELLRARLALALRAVLADAAPLTPLALAAGFASPSHFSARFRRFFGQRPSELRRIVTAQAAARA